MKARITIIGLGRIGTSIGLGLRKIGGNFEIVGHDPDGAAQARAKKMNAVDRTIWNLPASVEGAALIILALPVGEVRKVLEVIAQDLPPRTTITDTTTLKAPVMAWADQLLPDGVSFVGGDPIVTLGEDDEPSADVFKDAVYCLSPSRKASTEAVKLASDLVAQLGAKPYFLDAAEHDGLMAAVDHLPPLLAAALLDVTTSGTSWKEMRRVAAQRYEKSTDLGASSVAAFPELYVQNRDNVLHWLDRYIETLTEWRKAIVEGDAKALSALFEQALDARARWLSDRRQAVWETEGLQTTDAYRPNFMRQMFLGNLGRSPEEIRGEQKKREEEKRRGWLRR